MPKRGNYYTKAAKQNERWAKEKLAKDNAAKAENTERMIKIKKHVISHIDKDDPILTVINEPSFDEFLKKYTKCILQAAAMEIDTKHWNDSQDTIEKESIYNIMDTVLNMTKM